MNNFNRQNNNPFSMIPPVVKSLLMVNIAVFLLEFLLKGFRVGDFPLYNLYFDIMALQPLSNNILTAEFYPWQLITYQYMHGGLMHLFFNMFALWMFGSELETLWGSRKFLIYYTFCGIGAGLLQIFTADAPTVGASGSIFGLLAAFGMTFPNRQVMMFPLFIPIPAKFFVILFGAIEIFSGFSSANSGVAHFAHVAGALTGVFLLLAGPKLGIFRLFEKYDKNNNFNKTGYYNSSDNNEKPMYDLNNSQNRVYNQPKIVKMENDYNEQQNFQNRNQFTLNIDGEDITQAKINIILDKINTSGYQNLTEKEKHILIELSKKIK